MAAVTYTTIIQIFAMGITIRLQRLIDLMPHIVHEQKET